MSPVVYARGFFDLQLEFARTASTLSGRPYPQALLEYTNLYIRFALGREPDERHPTWQEYLAGLDRTPDAGDWTYRFYLARAHADASPPVVATFGCFGYARLGRDRIRLHFRDAETDGHSPLTIDRRPHRLAELTALFGHVKRTVPEPVLVVGASWLYNLQAYRRLYPDSYVATARVMRGRFQRMPLWGQFLDRHGAVRAGLAHAFLERLGRLSSMDGLEQCFPFQVLTVAAPAADFHAFYGV